MDHFQIISEFNNESVYDGDKIFLTFMLILIFEESILRR